MKILITGGAGFIGSNFIHYWMNNHPDDRILNFDALTYAGNLENLRSIENNSNYSFVQGDICDAEVVNDVMQGIDIVVHFAAETHVDRSIMNPSAFIETNVLGTQVLLDAAVKNNVKRFHHISTDEVFGSLSLEETRKFTEETKYDPRSPYAASKAGSDHLVRAYHITYGLPITITNCSNNFGPFMFPEKFIPLAITNLLEGKKIPVYGDGLNIRDWLYVEDHCRAIDVVLSSGKIGETYLVGGMTQLAPNIEIARKIIKLLGKNEDAIEFVKDRPGHDRKYDVDWSKINRELGWKPLHSFDEWLEKTVIWYQENRSWWEHIKSGAYADYYKQQYSDKEK
jgi:dTDP-glucose 4,6-dehydratase